MTKWVPTNRNLGSHLLPRLKERPPKTFCWSLRTAWVSYSTIFSPVSERLSLEETSQKYSQLFPCIPSSIVKYLHHMRYFGVWIMCHYKGSCQSFFISFDYHFVYMISFVFMLTASWPSIVLLELSVCPHTDHCIRLCVYYMWLL